MARKPNDDWNPTFAGTADDIHGFVQRPLPYQIANLLGRIDALTRSVGRLEENLDGLFIEYAIEYEHPERAEPVETIEELLEIVLTLEARVTALKGGVDLLFMALDADGPLGEETRELKAAKLSLDLGLPPVGDR